MLSGAYSLHRTAGICGDDSLVCIAKKNNPATPMQRQSREMVKIIAVVLVWYIELVYLYINTFVIIILI